MTAAARSLMIRGAVHAVVLVLCLAAIVFGPALSGHDPLSVDLEGRFAPPFSADHLLGADQLGRDVTARLIVGLQRSLLTALFATGLAFVIGTAVGLAGAREGGVFSAAVRQLTTFAQSFPVFVLAVAVIAALRDNGFWAVVLTLGLVTWPVFARVVQAETRVLLTREYVLAARMMQMGALRLYLAHVLPALTPSLSILLVFHFADMIIAESALSFLGIGAPLGAPSWGAMLSDSRAYMLNAPWLLLAPAGCIVVLVICAHDLGQRLRNRL